MTTSCMSQGCPDEATWTVTVNCDGERMVDDWPGHPPFREIVTIGDQAVSLCAKHADQVTGARELVGFRAMRESWSNDLTERTITAAQVLAVR